MGPETAETLTSAYVHVDLLIIALVLGTAGLAYLLW
jgi:hypothetical protein